MNNLNFILPEIFISLSIMFLLIFGVFKKNSSSLVHNFSIVFLLITVILILNDPLDKNVTLFRESYIIDNLSYFMKILTILGGALVLSISTKYLRDLYLLNFQKLLFYIAITYMLLQKLPQR